MVYVKHPEHGNKHVSREEAEQLVTEGWVVWPRSKEAKAGFQLTYPTSAEADSAPQFNPVDEANRPKRAYVRKAK